RTRGKHAGRIAKPRLVERGSDVGAVEADVLQHALVKAAELQHLDAPSPSKRQPPQDVEHRPDGDEARGRRGAQGGGSATDLAHEGLRQYHAGERTAAPAGGSKTVAGQGLSLWSPAYMPSTIKS